MLIRLVNPSNLIGCGGDPYLISNLQEVLKGRVWGT